MLLGVSGVGPKGALGILSAITPESFSAAVLSDNIAAITKAPGVGKKTAQRIILELKDKIQKLSPDGLVQPYVPSDADETADAVEALVSLGYSQAEALRAVRGAAEEAEAGGGLSDLIRISLRLLAAGKA
jgi:Holliday junction DNA helicase RuvA